jgi:hypothetical protein
MRTLTETKLPPCEPACAKIVKVTTDHEIAPSSSIGLTPRLELKGYRYINVFVQFNQVTSDEAPVDLSLIFGFDAKGTMAARRYLILGAKASGSQDTSFIEVSGSGSWQGTPHNISSYLVRVPVMGPFVEVVLHNRAPIERTVSVWAYLVS